MAVLSAKDLVITPNMSAEQLVQANSQAILHATDGAMWLCVCSGEAMTKLFGAARRGGTYMVENIAVTFVNMHDAKEHYGQGPN